MLMLKQIRRFSELERPARGLFLQASVLLPLISISVQWFGLQPRRYSSISFRPNPRNNHAHWMDPCGCSACVSMGAKRQNPCNVLVRDRFGVAGCQVGRTEGVERFH